MITVFGSINMDLIATVSRLPKPGETLAGSGFSTAAGGKGANQALAARRAGAEVSMVGAVGRDAFAEEALALIRAAGVDLGAVKSVDAPTGTASILVGDENGENVIVVVAGANGEVAPADADAGIVAMGEGDTLLLQLEVPAASVDAALEAGRKAGFRTILNTAPLTADAARLAQKADIVVANETEFALLIGDPAAADDASTREAALQARHAANGQTIIVTLGAEGVVAVHEGKIHRAQSLKIKPVDTVGAGDTFCGYLAAALDRGDDFGSALTFAAAAGSLACLKPGAQPAIPVRAEVEAALTQRH